MQMEKNKISYGETSGYTMGGGLAKPQEAKVQAIQEWPRLTTEEK